MEHTTRTGHGVQQPERTCFAYVTLLTTDSYLPGVQVLARSLGLVHAKHPLVVLHTGKLSQACMDSLKLEGCHMHQVEPWMPKGEDSTTYKYQCYEDCWNKLYMWTLDSYERLIYLDADMLVRTNIDHLFEQLPPGFYAVRDCYFGRFCEEGKGAAAPSSRPCAAPDDYFNAGFMVLSPSRQLFDSYMSCLAMSAERADAWQQHIPRSTVSLAARNPHEQKVPCGAYAEQDFLNAWWHGKWHVLPWSYNAQKSIIRLYPNVWCLSEAVVVHYTESKPWERNNSRYT